MISNPYSDLELEKQKEMERLQTLLAAAKQEEDAFKRDRALALGIGGAADAFSNVGSFGSIMLGRQSPKTNVKESIESSFGEAPTEAARLQKLIDASRGDVQGLKLKGIERGLEVEDEKSKRAFLSEMLQKKLDAETTKASMQNEQKPLGAEVGKMVLYGKQAERALEQAAQAIGAGFDPTKVKSGLFGITRFTSDSDQQKFNDAVDSYNQAILRLESGGAITPEEVVTYRKNAPRIGDTAETINAKFGNLSAKIAEIRGVVGEDAWNRASSVTPKKYEVGGIGRQDQTGVTKAGADISREKRSVYENMSDEELDAELAARRGR